MSKQQELKVGKPSCIEVLQELVAQVRQGQQCGHLPTTSMSLEEALVAAEELIGRVVIP